MRPPGDARFDQREDGVKRDPKRRDILLRLAEQEEERDPGLTGDEPVDPNTTQEDATPTSE